MKKMVVVALAVLFFSGCNTDRSWCEKIVQCDEDDKLDDDALEVCYEEQAVIRDVASANKEDECREVLEKRDAYRSCLLLLQDCNLIGAASSDTGGEAVCTSERDDYLEAATKADECSMFKVGGAS